MSAYQAADRLAMTVDDAQITADGSDMTRVLFRAVDEFGNQRRYRFGEVTLNLDGPGELVGDNPFAFGVYGGLGAVWIRSIAGRSGTITVSAAHPALGQAEVRVHADSGGTGSVPV
jgi:beta-galactosidase